MSWKVDLTNSAQRDIRQLPDGPKSEALDIVEALIEDGPEAVPTIEMEHYPGRHRTRFYREAYRMIFDVLERRKSIRIVRIRPRSTAYRGLKRPNP